MTAIVYFMGGISILIANRATHNATEAGIVAPSEMLPRPGEIRGGLR